MVDDLIDRDMMLDSKAEGFLSLIARMKSEMDAVPVSSKRMNFVIDNDRLILPDLDVLERPDGQAETSSNWLKSKCSQVSVPGFSRDEVYRMIADLLQSDSSNDDISSTFVDILGYDNLELVSQLIERRQYIIPDEQPSHSPHPVGLLLQVACP
jgi:hypothetical protein